MRNKKALEMNFAWMFSIIVGAAVIFLAVFAAIKLANLEGNIKNTEVGKEFSTLLNPVETSIDTSKTTLITLPQETRIYNDCSLEGTFGVQSISAATESAIGEKWQKPGVASKFYNKYLFSTSVIQGKTIYIFVKSFSMPYKVADLILLYSDEQKFCFINPQNDVREEVTSMGLKNINLNSTNCSNNEKKVCFERSCSSSADIFVDTTTKTVKKKGMPTMYYVEMDNNALLFAAIFSDPGLYECQIKRLMKRTSELAMLYSSKSDFLSARGCTSTSLQTTMLSYATKLSSVNSSVSLSQIKSLSDNIAVSNDLLLCKLF